MVSKILALTTTQCVTRAHEEWTLENQAGVRLGFVDQILIPPGFRDTNLLTPNNFTSPPWENLVLETNRFYWSGIEGVYQPCTGSLLSNESLC